MTVNMTKFNTVPTNMSDDMGNIITEMVTRGTSAVFGELGLAREDMHVKGYLNDVHNFILHAYMLSLQSFTSGNANQFVYPSLHSYWRSKITCHQ